MRQRGERPNGRLGLGALPVGFLDILAVLAAALDEILVALAGAAVGPQQRVLPGIGEPGLLPRAALDATAVFRRLGEGFVGESGDLGVAHPIGAVEPAACAR